MEIPIKAVIHRAEEGGYWAEVPALPGCVTEGDSLDDLIRNIREAVEGWLWARQDLAEAEAREAGEMISL